MLTLHVIIEFVCNVHFNAYIGKIISFCNFFNTTLKFD